MDSEGLDGLLSADGRALLRELAGEDLTARTELGLSTRLRKRYPDRLVTAAIGLTQLRARAEAKFSRAAEMWLTREGLEQASHEVVSAYRAGRLSGIGAVADLCTGIGGDLIALARGRRALAVDLDPVHLRMAALNAEVYGVMDGLECRNEDVRETDLSGFDAVFVDPARRRGGKREFRPEAYSPPLDWCLTLAEKAPAVAIKAAPGLSLDLMPPDWEVEFVSLKGDLKEAVLWSPALATVSRRATLLSGLHSLVPTPGAEVPCRPPGAFLLDPDPAITRAGLVEELARSLGAWKLDPEIAFLSSDQPLDTPFGRLLRIEESQPWGLKRLRATLRDLDVGTVDVRKRGSAVDVDGLLRALRPSGSRAATVVLTRVLGKPWALVCFAT